MNEVKQKKQNETRARTSVLRQLAALQTLSLEQLHEKWRDLYGTNPPKFKKQFLKKQLAYRIQELFYGGLSEETKSYIKNAAANDPMATFFQRKQKQKESEDKILPGTRFVRVWNGRRYEVIARDKGFEYEGCIYRSLSAVADKITGTHWSGKLFFGLKK